MERRAFISATLAGIGLSVLPAAGAAKAGIAKWCPPAGFVPPVTPPPGALFGFLFQGRWVWFHKYATESSGTWSMAHVVGDATARGQCRYRELEDGAIEVDWLTVGEPVSGDWDDVMQEYSHHPKWWLTRSA